MKFTKVEIKVAKQTRDFIISEDVDELKAVYMAGEICMWDELEQKLAKEVESKSSGLNIPVVMDLLVDFQHFLILDGQIDIDEDVVKRNAEIFSTNKP